MKQTAEQLEIFMQSFYSVKCTVDGDYLVYKTRKGFANKVAEQANRLIEKLGLNLVALPSTLSSADSFVVQSNEIEL